MKKYWKYIKPYLFAFICGPLLMIVEVVGEVVLPKLMANIINNGIAQRNVGYIIGTGGMILSAVHGDDLKVVFVDNMPVGSKIC